jgi:hypothetical protein
MTTVAKKSELVGKHKYIIRHGKFYQCVFRGLVHKCQSIYASNNFGNSCITVLEIIVNLSYIYL